MITYNGIEKETKYKETRKNTVMYPYFLTWNLALTFPDH